VAERKEAMKCSRCPAEAGGATKYPRGWKKGPDDKPWCKACWAKAFEAFVLHLPVGAVTDARGREGDPATQKKRNDDFRQVVRTAWRLSTEMANRGIDTLRAAEPGLDAEGRLGRPPGVYLYGALNDVITAQWPKAAGSANAVLRRAAARYKDDRQAVLAEHRQNVATFKWPFPYPVPSKDWSAKMVRDHPIFSLPLPGGRWHVRIRNDPTAGLDRRRLAQVMAGEAVGGELSLVGRPVAANDNRHAHKFRRPGGGEARYFRLMLDLAGWFPRREVQPGEGVLVVKTLPGSFLVAQVDGDSRPWYLHADHVRRWLVARDAIQKRRADDFKAEGRVPARKRRRRNERLEVHNRKFANRLRTGIDELSRWLVNYAVRRRVAVVAYDDTEQDWLPNFPWRTFAAAVERKLGQHGIDFSARGPAVGGDARDETTE
jgi:hypothetical protein